MEKSNLYRGTGKDNLIYYSNIYKSLRQLEHFLG